MNKKIRNKKISTLLGIIIIAVFALGVSMATAEVGIPGGEPGSNTKALIHRGAGEQTMEYLKVGTTSPVSDVIFDSTHTTKQNLFTGTASSTFLTLFNGWFADTLYIGLAESSDKPSHWTSPTNGISPQMQKVNVDGNLLSSALANIAGDDPVCVDAYGRFKLCTG